ncbi:hypothetical protein [Sandaracinus amylolyticus]|uniref:hypothetical protein n=1 Tax=Sandaracinus amylolyticus TaxID=927083 RepID=UPI001F21D844|nr:hypothetical protein [Sandaracinus amylolyticus]UJR81792.1 Hypothetical protein I5071_38520 [Sandaracinus amylolyticus]
MPRLISIADAKKRDAQIELVSPARGERVRWVSKGHGAPLKLERLIKSTEKTSFDALVKQVGSPEALSKALVEGDPEIDLEQIGRRLGNATRVWVGPEGNVLYAARVLQIVSAPDGAEKSRADFVDVEATVGEEQPPILWSGRLMPADQVVRRFALVRKVQLRHVNGLTFDFLHDIAAHLDREQKLLVVGAGPKAALPLIFQTNGSPFRGFLEGRVEGERYKLVLHLSNLEIKRVAASPKDVALPKEGA